MRMPLFLLFFIASTSYGEPAPADAPLPYVFNVRVGLADEARHEVIPAQGATPYQENGACLIALKLEPCMKWGISFLFRHMEPGMKMQCVLTASQPAKVYSSLSESSQDELVLEEIEAPFEIPIGYKLISSSLQREPGDSGLVTLSMRCSIEGQELINENFTVDMDPAPR